jgi:hypothetical protein
MPAQWSAINRRSHKPIPINGECGQEMNATLNHRFDPDEANDWSRKPKKPFLLFLPRLDHAGALDTEVDCWEEIH